MNTRQAYNNWASQYDTNKNKTRDLEGQALRDILADLPFSSCLEIGCGTGKNTSWLAQKARQLTAVDLSEEMLAKARKKISSDLVTFVQADIQAPWTFASQTYDLVSFSLVLEHIGNLEPVFAQAAQALQSSGHLYLGELHPFKQYAGTKARFDTPEGRQEVPCFTHHISDFLQAATGQDLQLVKLKEYFDQDDRQQLPRILTLLFRKP